MIQTSSTLKEAPSFSSCRPEQGFLPATYELPNDQVTYNFRYFLPHPPLWGSDEHCGKRLAELIAYCNDARIDAVQFFVNTRWGTYYMPAKSAAEQADWIAWMGDVVAPALRSKGISYQLNYQMLLGAGTWGQDIRDLYDWEFLIDQHGRHADGCACPAGSRFRKSMGEMLRAWAGTEPEVIWIDDDFRFHNHRIDKSRGMDYYCFCEDHLRRFAEWEGTFHSREEIVAAMERPGTPDVLRLAWMEFLGTEMEDLAAWVRSEIHSVAPACRVALMTSWCDVHSFEGRNWERVLGSLSGDHRPMVRPPCGVYTSNVRAIKDNAVTFQFVEQKVAMLDGLIGPGRVDYGPELENARFTSWANSAIQGRYRLELSQLLGLPQITLSLNDLEGSPLSEEPANLPMLRDSKDRLQAICDLRLSGWDKVGVGCVLDPDLMRKVEFAEGTQMGHALPERGFESVLAQCGIPLHYVLPGQDDLPEVVLLEKETAWAFDDAQLERVLSRGVLMDAEAAQVLIRRGFGADLGVTVGEKFGYAIQSEIYHAGVLPGVYSCRVPHKGFNGYLLGPAGAKIASGFVDARDRVTAGSTIFQNARGGRVVVYGHCGNCDPYATWANHARIRWLHGALRFLSVDTFPVIPLLRSHGLCIVRRKGAEWIIALANLAPEALSSMSFVLPRLAVVEAHRLVDDRWEAIPSFAGSELTVQGRIEPFEWLVTRLRVAGFSSAS